MIERLPATGTFLEIGANDGFSQSNTYYLERRLKWTGILIEPQPNLLRICRVVRRNSHCFNFACIDDESVTSLDLVKNITDLMAVTVGQQAIEDEEKRIHGGKTITVAATTLSKVIDLTDIPHITFMSIDVEGAELSVLGGLDWDRHGPDFLLVETDYPDRVDELVAERMNRTAQLSVHDYLWEKLD